MKKLIPALLLLVSCGESLTERYDRYMTELDCPVVLIGKTDKAVRNPSITVRDGSGRIRTFRKEDGGSTYHQSSGLPASISDSRMIGDTIKPCLP
jgi:hypothetical protein